MESVIQDAYPLLVKLALRVVGDDDDAQDVVQTVLERLFTICPIPRNPKAYLAAAVENEARRLVRDRKRHVELLMLGFATGLLTDLAEPHAEQASSEDPADVLDRLIALLPRACATVVRLRAEGLSYKAIAAQRGISRKTVDNHLQHAARVARREREREEVRSVEIESLSCTLPATLLPRDGARWVHRAKRSMSI